MSQNRRLARILYCVVLSCVLCFLGVAIFSRGDRTEASFEQRYLIKQPTNSLERYALEAQENLRRFLGRTPDITNIEHHIEGRFPLEQLDSRTHAELGRLAEKLAREHHWEEAYWVLYYQALRNYESEVHEVRTGPR